MKYGPEKTEELCQLLRNGSNRNDACCIADIANDTFYQWLQKPEFSEAIKKAEATCKNRNIAIIQKAAITTWQAAAWWLERKHQSEFAIKIKTEETGFEAPKKMAKKAAEILKELENGNVKVHG